MYGMSVSVIILLLYAYNNTAKMRGGWGYASEPDERLLLYAYNNTANRRLGICVRADERKDWTHVMQRFG